MKTAPPAHLSAEMQTWWRGLAKKYRFSSQHYKVLLCGCEAFDLMTEARELRRREGLVTENRFGEKRSHPALAVERDSRTAFLRCIRELALGDEDLPAGETRPPLLHNRYVMR